MSTYAAFVMTYRRPAILKETVMALLAQSIAPSRILIVDNDPEQSAKPIAEHFRHKNVRYHSVGFNSGPAGAAYWGCTLLYEEGWEWILWVDDDDPPIFKDTIERIFRISEKYEHVQQIGIMGAVGVRFDVRRAKTLRIPDQELSGILEVDNIAGNQFPLIHKRVFDLGIFPNSDLFFGFEELEFNLRVKQAQLKIMVDGELLQKMRKHAGRWGFKRKNYAVKDLKKLVREYYTTRNLLFTLKKHGSPIGLVVFCFKSLVKTILGFGKGKQYGIQNAKYLISGLKDGFTSKMGFKYPLTST